MQRRARPQFQAWRRVIKPGVSAVTACKWNTCYLPEGGAVRSSMDAIGRGKYREAAIVERLLMARKQS